MDSYTKLRIKQRTEPNSLRKLPFQKQPYTQSHESDLTFSRIGFQAIE